MDEYRDTAENWKRFARYNDKSTANFRSVVGDVAGLRVCDLGCGDGSDLDYFRSVGACGLAGVDMSPAMASVARVYAPYASIVCAPAHNVPFANEMFDVVVSKWALQCCKDLEPVYKEIARILRPKGHFVCLLGHPIRQFMEQKRMSRDYWSRDTVESVLFDGQVTVHEPMHTLTAVIGQNLLDHFDLRELHEKQEYGCEQVDGATYPHYLLFRAQKRE